jgi:hypothetical protein
VRARDLGAYGLQLLHLRVERLAAVPFGALAHLPPAVVRTTDRRVPFSENARADPYREVLPKPDLAVSQKGLRYRNGNSVLREYLR